MHEHVQAAANRPPPATCCSNERLGRHTTETVNKILCSFNIVRWHEMGNPKCRLSMAKSPQTEHHKFTGDANTFDEIGHILLYIWIFALASVNVILAKKD